MVAAIRVGSNNNVLLVILCRDDEEEEELDLTHEGNAKADRPISVRVNS